MTNDPYTPDEAELIGTWVDAHRSEAWGGRADKSGEVRERSAEARRGIAKIKADALREAMHMFAIGFGAAYQGSVVRAKLNKRAENIEADPHD